MNNATLLCSDRTTHVKVVTLALLAATAVAIVGIAAHLAPGNPAPQHAAALRAAPMHAADGVTKSPI